MAGGNADGLPGGAASPAPRSPWQRAAVACRSFKGDLSLSEISGAMGDLGTLLPLLVGLVKTSGLNLGTTLIFTGLYNIGSGLAFGIPMPVQPMHTIAAVALSQSALTVPQIMTAGIFVSGCVLLLGATRMFGLVNTLIPSAVICGMQLGLGLQLGKKGLQLAWYANDDVPHLRGWWGPEGLLLGILALFFIPLAVYPAERQPVDGQRVPQEEVEGVMDDEQEAGFAKEDGEEIGEGQRVGQDGGGRHRAPDVEVAASGAHSGSSRGAKLQLRSGEQLSGQGNEVDGWSGAMSDSRDGYDIKAGGGLRGLLWGLHQRLDSMGQLAEQGLSDGTSATDAGHGARSGGAWASCSGGGCGGAGGGSGARVPAAIVVVGMGLLLTVIYHPEVVRTLRLGPSAIQAVVPSGNDWKRGIVLAGLPQVALTGLNSVIGVCQLAAQLFPERAASPDRVAFSVGAMNLLGCWFGVMPCCHGAGGLAAQARFGARSGAAPVFLGLCKLVLGLAFGSSLLALLQAFPAPLLGAMLVFSGLELAACGRGQRGERGTAVMLLTAAVTLAASNVGVGVLAGLACAYLLLCWDMVHERAAPAWQQLAAACGLSVRQLDAGGIRYQRMTGLKAATNA